MKDNLKCYLIIILILVLIPNECTSLSPRVNQNLH